MQGPAIVWVCCFKYRRALMYNAGRLVWLVDPWVWRLIRIQNLQNTAQWLIIETGLYNAVKLSVSQQTLGGTVELLCHITNDSTRNVSLHIFHWPTQYIALHCSKCLRTVYLFCCTTVHYFSRTLTLASCSALIEINVGAASFPCGAVICLKRSVNLKAYQMSKYCTGVYNAPMQDLL